MRARMVSKSSAARGRFTVSPPFALVEFWWRSMAYGPSATRVRWLILKRKSRALAAHHKFEKAPRSDKMGRCGGITPAVTIGPPWVDGDAAQG